MSHLYAHADPGEPAVHPSQHDPDRPSAVTRSGAGRDVTSHDPSYFRRVAQARNTAAELPGTARQPAPNPQTETDREAAP